MRGRVGMLGPIAALPRLSYLHLADCPFDRDPLCMALEPQASMLTGLPDYPALTHLSLSHFHLPLIAVGLLPVLLVLMWHSKFGAVLLGAG